MNTLQDQSPVDSDSLEAAERESRFQSLWEEFNSKYATEADCFDALFARLSGETCRRCESERLRHESGARTVVCVDCQKETSFTAGTFFSGIRRARPWLAAIWFVEHGMGLSGNRLHRLVDVSTSTAWEIMRKLSYVVNHSMSISSIGSVVRSAEFLDVFSRHSRRTPVESHPRAEEMAFGKAQTGKGRGFENEGYGPDGCATEGFASDGAASGGCETTEAGGNLPALPSSLVSKCAQETRLETEFDDRSQAVLAQITDVPIHVERLYALTGLEVGLLSSTLTILEIEGLIECQAGGWFCRSLPHPSASSNDQPALSSSVAAAVSCAIAFVRSSFHGIARKYLELYLAEFWCYVDREAWASGKLLFACSQFRKLNRADILAVVSPAVVNITPMDKGRQLRPSSIVPSV